MTPNHTESSGSVRFGPIPPRIGWYGSILDLFGVNRTIPPKGGGGGKVGAFSRGWGEGGGREIGVAHFTWRGGPGALISTRPSVFFKSSQRTPMAVGNLIVETSKKLEKKAKFREIGGVI